jgi:hypothetical protein
MSGSVIVTAPAPTTAQAIAGSLYRASRCLGANGGPGRQFECVMDVTAFVTIGPATPSGTGVVTRLQLFADPGPDAARTPADLDFYLLPTIGDGNTGTAVHDNHLIWIEGFRVPMPLRVGQSLDITRDVSAELAPFHQLTPDGFYPLGLGITASYYAPAVHFGPGPLVLPGYVLDFYTVDDTPFAFVGLVTVPEPSTGALSAAGLLAIVVLIVGRHLRRRGITS